MEELDSLSVVVFLAACNRNTSLKVANIKTFIILCNRKSSGKACIGLIGSDPNDVVKDRNSFALSPLPSSE